MYDDDQNIIDITKYHNFNFDIVSPDVSIKNSELVSNLNVNISDSEKSYSISVANEDLSFNNDDLNIDLGNFSTKNKYININQSLSSISWDNQSNFIGSSGNDNFYINNNTERNELINNHFLSTKGNDVYIGSDQNVDAVDYSNLEDLNVDTLGYKIDHTTGLDIFDKHNYESLNFNNSPVLDDQIFNDYLVVNKSNIFTNIVEDQIDILEDIEILRLTTNDDNLQINELKSNNIYDFISGDDKVIFSSAELPDSLTKLINLDKFVWNNTSSDNNLLNSYEFDVNYLKEDNVKSILIENYDSNNFNEKLPDNFIVQAFESTNNEKIDIINRLDIKLVDPLPDVINQGNPVFEQKFLQDLNDEDLFWLELHIYDYRTHGKGFIGADIDLEWDDANIAIDTTLFTNENVFGIDKLPIFQSLGELSISNESEIFSSLKGLSAGSLPVASQGIVLGDTHSDNTYSTFARIPLRNIDINNLPNFNLNLNSLPAVKNIKANKDDVIFLDNNSPKALVIQGTPEQNHIGTHFLTVSSTDPNFIQRNLVINVESVNDSPIPLSFEGEINNPLKVNIKQEDNYVQDLSLLFSDEDDSTLIYEVVSAPQWLSISDDKFLSGSPNNIDVGSYKVVVSASDGVNNPVSQEIEFQVININDSPEIIKPINLPEVDQDMAFNYTLTSNSFFDKDTLVDEKESLSYELVVNDSDNEISKILSIDKNTGNITVSTDYSSVGITNFTVRATDIDGLSVEQSSTLKVLNINDSPFITQNMPNFDTPIELDLGDEVSLEIDKWFNDYDVGFDPNENLTFRVWEDDGSGSLKPITFDENYWLSYHSENEKLTLKPIGQNIGDNYIFVSATDKNGLAASGTVPIKVKYKNNNPTLNYRDLDLLKSRIKYSGAEVIKAENLKNQNGYLDTVTFEIDEQSDFTIEIPFDIFNDPDIGIDPNEKLDYKLEIDGQILDSNELFEFDSSNLIFYGNSTDLGLDTSDGIKFYNTRLIANDNYGKQVSVDFVFQLQRSLVTPNIVVNPEEILLDEGNLLPLANLFNIQHEPVTGEKFKIFISNNQDKLDLINLNGEIKTKEFENNNSTEWIYNGTLDEINLFLENHSVKTRNPYAKGTFDIDIKIQSSLGETNIKAESDFFEKIFKINPLPNLASWLFFDERIELLDSFSFTNLDSLFNASSPDLEEEVFYFVNFPNEREDLFLTNSLSQSIGISTSNGILLTSEEWKDSFIRTNQNIFDEFQISLSAISKETNGAELQTPIFFRKLKPTAFIDNEAVFDFQLPEGIQQAGERSKISLFSNIDPSAKSLIISMILPKEAFIENINNVESPKYEQIIDLNENSNKIQFIFDNSLNNFSDQIDFYIKTKDSFNGELKGDLEIISSSRSIEDISFNNIAEDISRKFAISSDKSEFSWNVIQKANLPEFDNELNFDPISGKLSIGIRRGSSSNGFRNPNETISLSVSNIPSGYSLAEKINNEYRSVGAKDKFGTIALFNIPKFQEDNPEEINQFSFINSNNLYLVANDKNTPPLENNLALGLSISSLISGQIGGDSRSKLRSSTIDLTQFNDHNNVPILTKDLLTIDPLLIDFDDGKLDLISIDESIDLKFEMIPNSEPLSTGWISSNANLGGKNTAFIALNDKSNDLNGDVQINSITELFSEYFQSENGLRTYLSGVSALKSLDTDSNLKINSSDEKWDDILLWFDDGDAKSNNDEIYKLSEFVNNVDLKSYEIIDNQPNWNSGNQIIGTVKASKKDSTDQYNMFDVGLKVNPSQQSTIHLEVENFNTDNDYINMQENGSSIRFSLKSPESNDWIEQGLDELTLVRLSGLPSEIKPSIGVKDSRGDWLFTWSDLNKNGGELILFPPPFWSGSSNLTFLVSQLQSDGSLINSSIISYGLKVDSQPTKPLFRVQNQTINEDQSVNLINMVSIARLVDNDGSEKLHLEIKDSLNFQIYEVDLNKNKINLNTENGFYKIELDKLDKYYINPSENFAGQIELDWKAISTEIITDQIAETQAKNILYVNPIADIPLPIERINNSEALIQGSKLYLSKIIDVSDYNNGLFDLDGSEEIRYELEIPKGLFLRNFNDNNWIPLSNNFVSNKNVFRVRSEDLPYLEIYDSSFNNELVNISVTRISREISNGDESNSPKTNIELPFHKNALPANVTFNQPTIEEDSEGIQLLNLYEILPNSKTDKLSYKLKNISSNLHIFDSANNQIYTSNSPEIQFESLDNLIVKPNSNISGKFSFDFCVVSDPLGNGNFAETPFTKSIIEILPIADLPKVIIQNPVTDKLEINTNGWVNISDLGLDISSDDNDSSEEYSIIINALNKANEVTTFPNQIIFNTPHKLLNDGSVEVRKEHLSNLSLYLDEIIDDLKLKLTPKSIDGNSITLGNSEEITVKANLEKIIVKVPLLQVSGSIQGYEDTAIPILNNIGGVVSAKHRDIGMGQTLFLELSNLPENSKIIKLLNDSGGQKTFSSPINFNTDGMLNTSLRLPYHKWDDLYVSFPNNKNGEFQFSIKAISIGDETLEEKSTQNLIVRTILTPVNDAPLIINFNDLDKADEGGEFHWNLRNRFIDIDNENNELFISLKFKDQDGEFGNLPSWLTLSNDGILTSNATNDQVGIYTLKIKANDPLGGQIEQEVKLEIGNVNQKPFFLNMPSGWTDISDENNKEYEKSINLNNSNLLSLENMFDDIDIKHGDSLSFQVSKDGTNWENELANLCKINNSLLVIKPQTKQIIGNQKIFLRAIDQFGSNSTIKLSVNVLNINETPSVSREEAIKITNSLWEEEIDILPGKTDLNLDLRNLFVDPDLTDIIDEISPVLPNWLTLEKESGITGGVLKGKPSINDIGELSLDFNAFDQSGKIITYRLKINVQNINDAPVLVQNPDLSSLGEIVDNIPKVLQNSYAALNPNLLFDDEDFPFGDSLSYELIDIFKIENNNEVILENPDWINLSYKTTTKADAKDKFLIEPVFFIEDNDGKFTQKVEINDLSSLNENTKLKIVVEASDNRVDDVKGLVGLDLDVTTSNSLEIISQSIKLSEELPLFNKIVTQRKGFRVEAGSAPDLGIGGSIGDDNNEELLSFEAILKSPELKVMVSLTPGIGDFRDGLTTRNAITLNEENSVIHSITNQEGAEIEILAPDNQNVGLHKINVKATDQSGESVIGSFLLNIENLNDAPTLNASGVKLIQNLLDKKFIERDSVISNIIKLFDDQDIIHNDSLDLSLFFENNNYFDEFGNTPDSISLQSDSKGNIKLKFDPPSGLFKNINPRFAITATDEYGLEITSPFFQTEFIPKPEITILTSSNNKTPLKLNNLGTAFNKNIVIDLGKALNINSPELNDPKGDEVFINLKVKSSNSKITTSNLETNSLITTTKENEETIKHIINLSKIKDKNIHSNLEGFKLSIDPNTFSKIPSSLSNEYKYGVPIEIWTSTKVADDANNLFGTEDSTVSKFWIPIINSRPVFLPAKPLNLDDTFINNNEFFNNVLFELSENVLDLDPSDEITWEVKIPDELRELIKFDDQSRNITFTNEVSDFSQFPLGNHRIKVTAKDSSFYQGDLSAKVKGILRINIVDNSNTNEIVNGLTLIDRLGSDDIKAIFNRFESNENLLNEESDLINIFQKLNKNETNRDNLIDKIASGSAAILNNSQKNMPIVLLDSIAEDELLLLNAKQEEVDEEIISASRNLLKSANYVDSPIGKLEFSIDTNGKAGAYVDINLEDGGVNINELIKTTANNESHLFQSQVINYSSETDGDFENWLKDLNYNFYNYSEENDLLIGSLKRSDNLENLNISDKLIGSIDGSAYLIDKDGDQTIDVISMFLLDQGFFDTDIEINVIGDPLIPIETSAIEDPLIPIETSAIEDPLIPIETSAIEDPLIPIETSPADEIISQNSTTNVQNNSLNSQDSQIPIVTNAPFNNSFPASSINLRNQSDLSETDTNVNTKSFFDIDNSIGERKIQELKIKDVTNNKLNDLQNNQLGLLENFKRSLNDVKENLNNLFEYFNNNQFLSILGALFLPIAGERVLTPIAKNMEIDYKLNLRRRNPKFTGKWIFETSKGASYVIVREAKNLKLNFNKEKLSNYKFIKGFDLNGNSLLYKALLLSSKPGVFINQIEKIQKDFSNIESFDVNWDMWLNNNLFQYIDQEDKYAKNICKNLLALANDPGSNEICDSDIIMFAHIVDCCDNLLIHKKNFS